MLLAAGRGRRMEPLSSVVAKPALDVAGRPLLSAALRALRTAGCSRIVANLHRHPDQVRRAVAAACPAARFSPEPELLGGAGGVAAARPLFLPGPVLAANADVWTDLELAPLVAAGADDAAVLALVEHPDRRRWSSVELAPDGRIVAISPAGAASGYLFSGFQLIGAEVLRALPSPPAEWGPVWRTLMRAGRLHGVVVQGAWREAGDPGSYRRLVADTLAGGSWVAPAARVGAGATVHGSAVGPGCSVAAGAAIIDSVLTEGADVGAGATLRRCVVAAAAVPAGATMADVVVTPAGAAPLR